MVPSLVIVFPLIGIVMGAICEYTPPLSYIVEKLFTLSPPNVPML